MAGVVCWLIASGAIVHAQTAKAESNDALLEQVKQQASQGQDSDTAAQISQYVNEHQDVISAILGGYLNYIKQIQAMSADDGIQTPANRQPVSITGARQDTVSGSGANATASGGEQASALQASTSLQVSSGLQTSSVQPSGGLQTGHLAGYPSLPDVDPVSSVTRMSAEQTAYAAKVREENQARKESLMGRP